MLFKPDLIDKIVRREKTQTRRPYYPDKHDIVWSIAEGKPPEIRAIFVIGRRRWAVGRDYSVQPGRGKRGVWWDCEKREYFDGAGTGVYPDGFKPLRIRITRIRIEDVRLISANDAIAEGFKDVWGFWATWCGFYDPKAVTLTNALIAFNGLHKRPDERYQAVALDFEIAQSKLTAPSGEGA